MGFGKRPAARSSLGFAIRTAMCYHSRNLNNHQASMTTWRARLNPAIVLRMSLLLVVGVAIVPGCSRPGIKGDGVIITTNRPVSDFSALVVNGVYKIKWSSGKPALTISTDQNLL